MVVAGWWLGGGAGWAEGLETAWLSGKWGIYIRGPRMRGWVSLALGGALSASDSENWIRVPLLVWYWLPQHIDQI